MPRLAAPIGSRLLPPTTSRPAPVAFQICCSSDLDALGNFRPMYATTYAITLNFCNGLGKELQHHAFTQQNRLTRGDYVVEKNVTEEVQDQPSNAIKDPDQWVTGEEPMTGAQKSYLSTLSEEAGVEMDEKLNKADASKRIEELQQKTGRGTSRTSQN